MYHAFYRFCVINPPTIEGGSQHRNQLRFLLKVLLVSNLGRNNSYSNVNLLTPMFSDFNFEKNLLFIYAFGST